MEFDLVVIGAGPAGYVGAIRAAQLGMKVACIEKRKTLGGTCLNVGCIPSKALLHSSEKYSDAKNHFKDIGIETDVKLNLSKMMENKNKTVSDLTKGINGLFAKNKIERFFGNAKIVTSNKIEVKLEESDEIREINTKNILIATGSEAVTLPGIEIDEKIIVSSTGALDLDTVPNKMLVIGAGVIGIELGSVWQRLGAEVLVVEYANRMLPMLDLDIANNFQKILEKQGMLFQFNTKVIKANNKNNFVEVELEHVDTGKKEILTVDKVLVAIGRKPNTSGLGLENLAIELDSKGSIKVDEKFRTKYSNIYAVGDVITGPMLAHKAEEEAVAAVENMAGQYGHVNYHVIPSVIYTWPEVASVGFNEKDLKEKNIEYKIGKFPFLANSRAKAINNTDGMVKIIADAKTDEILGAQIIAPEAGNMIHEVIVAMEFRASSEDLARTCHAHPTLNEAIKEACLAVDKRTINL